MLRIRGRTGALGADFASSRRRSPREARRTARARARVARRCRPAHARLGGGGEVVAEPVAALLGTAAIEIARGNAAPHSFADVAVAIAKCSVGVAENGAVAVTVADAPHRALLFLAERVILLLDAASIAGDLHSAMRVLPAAAWQSQLTFISGPSKTADIEQTLVHGAHGPRALAVFLHQP
jgi:L-lactate utilization protein LutC